MSDCPRKRHQRLQLRDVKLSNEETSNCLARKRQISMERCKRVQQEDVQLSKQTSKYPTKRHQTSNKGMPNCPTSKRHTSNRERLNCPTRRHQTVQQRDVKLSNTETSNSESSVWLIFVSGCVWTAASSLHPL